MAETERIAASPPHGCKVVALDTMARRYQLSEEHIRLVFDARGLERPSKMRSNEDWYIRQGYEIMPTVGEGKAESEAEQQDTYAWTQVSGEVEHIPIVWMKKDLV